VSFRRFVSLADRRSERSNSELTRRSISQKKPLRMPGTVHLEHNGRKMEGFDRLALFVRFVALHGNSRPVAWCQREGADGSTSRTGARWGTHTASAESVPRRVDHVLSDAGKELIPVMEAMCAGAKHLGVAPNLLRSATTRGQLAVTASTRPRSPACPPILPS
jgi:hypothetical protein